MRSGHTSTMVMISEAMIAAALLSIPAVVSAAAPTCDDPSKLTPSLRRLMEADPGSIRAWVFFADKGPIDIDVAIAALHSTYDDRAIERRRLRRTAPGLFDERDIPVAGAYLDAIAESGADIRTRSSWLNAVSIEATAEEILAIARRPFVEKIQPVRSLRTRPPHGPAPHRAAGDPDRGGFYGFSEEQLEQITVTELHAAGFTGAGVLVGVLDTGFRRTHAAYNHPDHPLAVHAEYDFVNDDPNTAQEPGDPVSQHEHGTLILGTMGAYLPEVLVGGAYDASFILAKVEDVTGEYWAEEDMFVAGLQFIEAEGGDVATSSVVIYDHYTQAQLNGETSVMTIGFNAATDNGVHCHQGAGNEGHDNDPATSHLLPPADAFGVLTIGAVDLTGAIAYFSSDGPTADGRVKPEVLTRGVDTYTTHPHDDLALSTPDGTSLATPLAAAATACLVQAHPEWTVNQMRAALMQTGDHYVAHGAYDPLYIRGYGIIDAFSASQTDPPRADLDGDCDVDIDDLLLLLAAWGPCSGCLADLDGDGVVNVPDLLELLAAWGPCGQ